MPLQSCVKIDILLLIVVLNKGGEKKFIGKRYINPRTNQPKIGMPPWLRQIDAVVNCAKRNTCIWLKPVTKINTNAIAASICIIATKAGRDRISKKFLWPGKEFNTKCLP